MAGRSKFAILIALGAAALATGACAGQPNVLGTTNSTGRANTIGPAYSTGPVNSLGPGQAPPPSYPVPRTPAQPLRPDQVAAILAALKGAETEGFRAGEFYPANLDAQVYAGDPTFRAQGEALLRANIIRYARAQHGLRIVNWPKNWAMKPPPYDAENDFNLAVKEDRVVEWIDGLPPPFDRYRALRSALARYKAIVSQGGWPTVEGGAMLKPGAVGPRVTALRQRLMAEEPSLNLDTSSDQFDDALTEAVKYYQRRNGFDASGKVDTLTLEAMNVPAQSRVLQIIANMERWRWEPRLWPATRIEVNIAAAEMDLFEENALVLEMRAAPGRPDDQSPLLTSQIESVVLNPPWNVPANIAEKEYYTKEAAHPGYLAAHGFRFIETPDGGRRLQQKSGPKSALGQIKFDFPNPFAVYMHDTPTRRAFSLEARNVSHGCVRLERPLDLADKLFAGDETWTPDQIRAAIATGKTQRVQLERPVRVFLMYWTVFPDVKGRMDFRNDVYDWDSQLLGLIDAAH
jgi:murein L,D-transpeptidase YcbB/YkuD